MSEANAAESELRVETSEESAVVRTVSVEVPQARVHKAFDRAYRNLARSAQVKGFRRGKVPRKVLERVYGAAAAEEIERTLVSETISDALELAEVEPVTEPDIDARLPEEDQPFHYSARVEVKPVIELPKLDGLPGTKPKVAIDDAAVDERLEALRANYAPVVEIPEGEVSQNGDTVHVDFEGRVDGELFEGGSAEDIAIELGSGRMIPGFEDQLLGLAAGQDGEVRVTFPDDYGEERLQGKDATFSVKVRTVKRTELPALDDEFAVDVGEESLEDLRAKLLEQLTNTAEQQARSTLNRSLMDALIERCEFDVPPGLVERQLHQQMRSMQEQFHGKVSDDVLQAELDRLHQTGREPAARRVREALLMDAIVLEQQLEVEDDAIDARLDELAEQQGTDSATMRRLAESQGWRQSIRAELLNEAVLDFLAAGASVEETSGT